MADDLECQVPRCALCNSFSDPILDVRHPDRLLLFAGTRKMDVVIQPEPDGRGGGRFPLDADWQCRSISTLLFHLVDGGAVIIGKRFHLLQKNRRYLCGCDLMSDIAIRVENLGKKYKIGANQTRYQTLRESIMNGFSNSIERIRGNPSKEDNIIWALKDINFEVKHGEVLGIIGRNGAGKSTLLKILSRITKPTTGRFELNGRVGSLLEVGTGFHPELTGRDNIYLSGAILGMKRKEINRKFDEIVDFAEIEKFLDTPVKHYSSGMYMRLAFSVAAHLEPEILLVDEVLAVGDAEFQKKCLGKMGDVAGKGRTVLFVSHNMGIIRQISHIGLYLKSGFNEYFGLIDETITKYLTIFDSSDKKQVMVFPEKKEIPAQFLSVSLINNRSDNEFDLFEKLFIDLKSVVNKDINGVAIIIILKRNGEILFVSFDTDEMSELLQIRKKGHYISRVYLPSPLKAGIYSLDISIGILNSVGLDTYYDVFIL